MVTSIAAYYLTAIVLYLLAWHAYAREERRVLNGRDALGFFNWEFLCSIGLVTLFMALRYHTGYDHEMYMEQYAYLVEHGKFLRPDFEPGFLLVTKVFAAIKAHYAFYFAFWALAQVAAIFFALRHRKFVLPWVMVLLLLGPYSINYLTFMRQWTIACLMLLTLPLFERRNIGSFLVFLLFVALAMTIHKSAILLVLFYWLPFGKIASLSRRTYIIAIVACIVLGLLPYWIIILRPLKPLMLAVYAKYDYLLTPLLNLEFSYMNWGFLHCTTVFTHVFALWFFPQVRRMFSDDKWLPIIFTIAFLGVCYENLFINTSYFLVRPCDFTYIFLLILLGYTFTYLYKERKLLPLAIGVIVMMAYVFINVLKVSRLPEGEQARVVLYNFFFMQ